MGGVVLTFSGKGIVVVFYLVSISDNVDKDIDDTDIVDTADNTDRSDKTEIVGTVDDVCDGDIDCMDIDHSHIDYSRHRKKDLPFDSLLSGIHSIICPGVQ